MERRCPRSATFGAVASGFISCCVGHFLRGLRSSTGLASDPMHELVSPTTCP